MKTLLFILTSYLLTMPAMAQSPQNLTLQWKIAVRDSLVYKIAVLPINNRDELPYAQKLPATIAGLLDSMQASLRFSPPQQMDADLKDYPQSLLAGYLGIGSDPEVFAKLMPQRPGAIDVQIYSKKSAEYKAEYLNSLAPLLELADEGGPSADTVKAMIAKMVADTALEYAAEPGPGGCCRRNAKFYLPLAPKNILALLFELPKNPAGLHDHWPLDVHFIVEQGLTSDSSFRRAQVTLREIRIQKQDQIAVLDYDFTEFVAGTLRHAPATLAFSYRAVAEFSVPRGRWLQYDAIASMHLTGEAAAPFPPLGTQLLIRLQTE